MVVAIVALIVERDINSGKAFLGRLWAMISPSNRFAGDIWPLQSDALIGERKYC
jgi:hypothetical protein